MLVLAPPSLRGKVYRHFALYNGIPLLTVGTTELVLDRKEQPHRSRSGETCSRDPGHLPTPTPQLVISTGADTSQRSGETRVSPPPTTAPPIIPTGAHPSTPVISTGADASQRSGEIRSRPRQRRHPSSRPERTASPFAQRRDLQLQKALACMDDLSLGCCQPDRLGMPRLARLAQLRAKARKELAQITYLVT